MRNTAFARVTWTKAHAGFGRLRTAPVCGPCVLARLGFPQASRDCKPMRASDKCGLPAFAANVPARIPGFLPSHVFCGVPYGPSRQMVSRHRRGLQRLRLFDPHGIPVAPSGIQVLMITCLARSSLDIRLRGLCRCTISSCFLPRIQYLGTDACNPIILSL